MTRLSNSVSVVRYERALLLAIILIAVLLRIGNPDTIGAGNTYYTAAVDNMLDSASNFFYVTADAGGVTVDKPPVALWIQAIFAGVLGVSGWSVVLPSMLAGVLSVWVLYRMIKPRWGIEAGLLAAFVLAITPVSIAVDRTNNLDSILNLLLLLATWAFWHATDSETSAQRWRSLMLGAVLIGVAFNVKMLQAYLIVPALYALYFLGARASYRLKITQLISATVVLLVISLSWALIVDATPADNRPYVGGSETNSVVELIVGYNGLGRLLGVSAINSVTPPDNTNDVSGDASVDSAAQGLAAQFRPGGEAEIGTVGIGRLFIAPLANELAWLLPLAGFSIVLLLFSQRIAFPLNDAHQTLVLWGGWLVTGVIFFSISSFYHAYYLATLAPAVAALVGIGWAQLARLDVPMRRRWQIGGVVIIGLTLLYQQQIVVVDAPEWANSGYVLLVLFGLGLAMAWRNRQAWARGLVLTVIVCQPFAWSLLTAYDDGHNTTLPAAYPAQTMPNFIPSRPTASNTNASQNPSGIAYGDLEAYLVAQYRGETYFVAVADAMTGAPLTLMGDYAVLYTGGFNGQDDIYSGDDLAQMVDAGDLRFILTGGGMQRRDTQENSVTDWVEAHCVLAEGFTIEMPDLPSPPQGLPAPPQSSPTSRQGMPQMPRIGLYDCA